eukprot:6924376-Pyramimonas_sp.AAC.1
MRIQPKPARCRAPRPHPHRRPDRQADPEERRLENEQVLRLTRQSGQEEDHEQPVPERRPQRPPAACRLPPSAHRRQRRWSRCWAPQRAPPRCDEYGFRSVRLLNGRLGHSCTRAPVPAATAVDNLRLRQDGLLLQLGQQSGDVARPAGEEVLVRTWQETGCIRVPLRRAHDQRLEHGQQARRHGVADLDILLHWLCGRSMLTTTLLGGLPRAEARTAPRRAQLARTGARHVHPRGLSVEGHVPAQLVRGHGMLPPQQRGES